METLQDTSVAETLLFIKEFEFVPSLARNPHTALTFSDSTLLRLNPRTWNLSLRKDTNGHYSTDEDLWIRTWTTTPKALRKLRMVQVMGVFPENTSVLLRIWNGTNDLFWDDEEGSWEIAGSGDWNTEAEVNAHIEDYPILPNRSFAVTLNFHTNDSEVTPLVSEVKVLMEVKIDYIEDLILRSLVPFLEANIRPLANFPLPPLIASSDEIDLNQFQMDTRFNIVDVDAVYNWTNDKELLTNLLSSYDPGSKIITLTEDIDADEIPFVVFRYQPEVAYMTHQDWIEVASLPALILERLEIPLASAYTLAAREGIVDKGTGKAFLVHEPWRATFEFRLHVVTDKTVDELRFMSTVMSFFDKQKMIRSIGLDERYSMRLIREFRDLNVPDRADSRVFWTRFVIENVRMPFYSEATYGVLRVKCKISEPRPAHEDPTKGGARVRVLSHEDGDPSEWEEEFELSS